MTRQQAPRVLIASVTRTISTGPPPPPAYTPTAPDTGYVPVPPGGYQPVPAGTDSALNSPSDDIPSDPPPDYTPTAALLPVPQESAQ